MPQLTEAQFMALSDAEKLRVARLPANRDNLRGTMAMVMPHTRFADLSDSQMVQLAEASFMGDDDTLESCAVDEDGSQPASGQRKPKGPRPRA